MHAQQAPSATRRITQHPGHPKAAHVEGSLTSNYGLSANQLEELAQYMKQKFVDQSVDQSSSSTTRANMAATPSHVYPWIIDSGATEHITCEGLTLDEADWSG
ncbi:unnamed protein product [Cuscuta europaea]|uniref:Uncharacterized protein n=1 Tax=Cuscuta europaea TaxID=41803 RepID=A0A9P0YWG8_CUSEU|nr:unnamed protein product [Cuscuta europaea]